MKIDKWQETTLGDFVTLQRGHDLPDQERRSGKVPIIGSAGITGYHDKAIAKGPGVTVGRSGASFGVVTYTPVDYWPHNACLYVIDFHGNDERFAYYFLKSLDFSSFNSGSAQPSLNRNYIHPIEINIPSLPEQRAIARVLGALDDKIELNRRMNRTLESMARAVFREWFVECEEAGDWETTTLSRVCETIFSGGTPSTEKPEYWNGGIPWLSSGETRERFIIDTEKTITQSGVDNSSTRFARLGSTVIASAGQGKTRGQTSLLMFDSYINQSVVVLIADRTVSSDLFLFFGLSGRYEEFRQLSDSHSSRGSLTTKLLGGLKIAVPPQDKVLQFDQFAKPIIEHIYRNLQQSRTLASLRDSLLPRLMKGEVRVSEL